MEFQFPAFMKNNKVLHVFFRNDLNDARFDKYATSICTFLIKFLMGILDSF